MCAARGAAQFGQRLRALLPPLQTQAGRQTEGQARLSATQDEKEGTGQLPAYRLHRAVARKRKGSQNRKKAARRLGVQYRQVANQRTNTLHHLTSRLAKTKSVIVIEDLHVSGLQTNHKLAQAISDEGWGEFRRQLTYKAAWYGCRVIVADRWFASSKDRKSTRLNSSHT